MPAMETAFARWVVSHRVLIIALSLLAVVLAAAGGNNLRFTTNYRVFFSSDNPQLLAFEALENRFNKTDNVMFVLVPDDGNVFTAKTLAAVEWLTEQAWQTPYSTRVSSLSNFQHTEAQGDDLVVRSLVENAAEMDQATVDKVREIALAEPMLRRQVVAEDGKVTGVNVTVQMPGVDESVETPRVVDFARDLAARTEARYPHLQLRLPGMVVMNNAFSESSKLDMKTLVPASFGVMVIFLGLLLRGLAGTATTVLVIVSSILIAMGLGGWMGVPLSPPSATAPIIILTMAIANCVHVLVTYLHGVRSGTGKHEAMVESLRINLQPVFLASLTTALGFLSMNFSEVPPFTHLGNLVAMGVAAAFLLSVTFLPAVVTLLPAHLGKSRSSGGRAGVMEHFGDFVVRRQKVLLWSMCGVVVVLVASVPRNELNDVFVHYFDESVQFRQDSDFTAENLNGLYRLEYALESGQPGGISEPAFLADAERFAKWFEAQPEVTHVSLLTAVMKRLNKNMHGDDPAWYRLPDARDLAAQYLLLYEMSLPYGLDLNNQIDVEKSALRMSVSMRTISSNAVIAIEERAKAWLASNAPAIKEAEATGTTVMFSHIGARNIRSMLVGTTVALIFISLVLVLAFRSIKVGLVSLIPNLVPGAMGFGLWGLLVGEVGLSLSVVAGMTLGIVVDDTVHFLSKYLRARRENGYSSPDAVRYAFRTVGWALVVTTVVLAAGFLVLATSSFELNSGMGLLTAIVIVLALVADFLFLPPLLMKLEERSDAKSALNDPGPGRASA